MLFLAKAEQILFEDYKSVTTGKNDNTVFLLGFRIKYLLIIVIPILPRGFPQSIMNLNLTACFSF